MTGAPKPISGTTYARAAVLGTAAIAAAAWIAVVAMHASGRHFASHDAALTSGRGFGGVLAFLAGWFIMVATMMLPSVLRTVALRDDGVARFLAGYVVAWTGFGVVALAGDVTVHQMVDSWQWLAERPYIVAATVLVAAGLYQASPSKRRCLDAMRRGRSGARYTASCLGCCGGLMITMFAVGSGGLAWMTVLTAVMIGERTAANGRRIARVAGVLLVGMGVLAAVSSATLM